MPEVCQTRAGKYASPNWPIGTPVVPTERHSAIHYLSPFVLRTRVGRDGSTQLPPTCCVGHRRGECHPIRVSFALSSFTRSRRPASPHGGVPTECSWHLRNSSLRFARIGEFDRKQSRVAGIRLYDRRYAIISGSPRWSSTEAANLRHFLPRRRRFGLGCAARNESRSA